LHPPHTHIDLTHSDCDTVAESTILEDFIENRPTITRSQRGVADPNPTFTGVLRPSSSTSGEIGEDNVDVDTLKEIGRCMFSSKNKAGVSYDYKTSDSVILSGRHNKQNSYE
jgi:hypothetical protein